MSPLQDGCACVRPASGAVASSPFLHQRPVRVGFRARSTITIRAVISRRVRRLLVARRASGPIE